MYRGNLTILKPDTSSYRASKLAPGTYGWGEKEPATRAGYTEAKARPVP